MNIGALLTWQRRDRLTPRRLLGRLCRVWPVLFVAALLATSCSEMERLGPPPDAVAMAAPEAETTAPNPASSAAAAAENPPDRTPAVHPARAVSVPGTGVFVAPSARPRAAHVSVAGDGKVSFNFINADVRQVVREILGDQLHLNYVVDSKVQSTITAQTGGPLPRDAVLPTLEGVLRANGLALVDADNVYRVVPLDEAAKASVSAAPGQDRAGYAVRVLPLRYVSADQLKDLLAPFKPPGGVIQTDSARNLLIVTGTSADLDGFTDLVHQFDVDWLAGTSFALYPLQVGLATDVANELDAIFGEGGTGSLAGLVRIVPIERLNAILVISEQRSYLKQVKAWIDRLDYGDDQTTPRLFEYHVQNSRAADLAAVLSQLFSPSDVKTVQPEVAPGSKIAALLPQEGTGALSQSGALPGAGTPGIAAGGVGGVGAAGISASNTYGMPGIAGTPSLSQPQEAQRPGSNQQQRTPEKTALGLPHGPHDITLPSIHIVADEKNNALVIFARPRDYKMIEETIKRLDVVPLQVMIQATIAEVTLNNNLQYGLQWFFSHASNKFELAFPPIGASPNGSAGDVNPVFPGFNYILSGSNAKLVLSALSQLTTVNVVSSPHLLVLDHQTAALQVGDQVPIISQTAQSVITAGAPIVNSVQYLSTGVILQVTPRVNASGQITLDIDQSVSDVTKTTTSTIDSPTITQRRIVTSVVVQDGQTIALGGLILDNHNDAKSGIPVLSDIPVLGSLFGTTTRSSGRTELLVLLTPKIVRNPKEARDMTNELRDRMRALKPLAARIR